MAGWLLEMGQLKIVRNLRDQAEIDYFQFFCVFRSPATVSLINPLEIILELTD